MTVDPGGAFPVKVGSVVVTLVFMAGVRICTAELEADGVMEALRVAVGIGDKVLEVVGVMLGFAVGEAACGERLKLVPESGWDRQIP